MLTSDTIRVLRNGEKVRNRSSEKNPATSNHEDDVNCETKAGLLTQEDVKEQIKS